MCLLIAYQSIVLWLLHLSLLPLPKLRHPKILLLLYQVWLPSYYEPDSLAICLFHNGS
jgi:hypothetical protein